MSFFKTFSPPRRQGWMRKTARHFFTAEAQRTAEFGERKTKIICFLMYWFCCVQVRKIPNCTLKPVGLQSPGCLKRLTLFRCLKLRPTFRAGVGRRVCQFIPTFMTIRSIAGDCFIDDPFATKEQVKTDQKRSNTCGDIHCLQRELGYPNCGILTVKKSFGQHECDLDDHVDIYRHQIHSNNLQCQPKQRLIFHIIPRKKCLENHPAASASSAAKRGLYTSFMSFNPNSKSAHNGTASTIILMGSAGVKTAPSTKQISTQ